MYDEEQFITNEELGIKFKYEGGSHRPYADQVTGLTLKTIDGSKLTEKKVKKIAQDFKKETIYNKDDEARSWYGIFWSSCEKREDGSWHVVFVDPFTD